MYKIILATRYLLRRRITYFAVLAVALCVFIVLVVMTVMIGLVSGHRLKNHSFTGDCVVGTESLVGFAYYEDFVSRLEGSHVVEAVSPVVKSYALIGPRGSEEKIAVEIMGIDPVRHSRVTGFGQTLHYHIEDASKAFESLRDPNLPGCVFGIDVDLQRDMHNPYSVICFPLTAKGALADIGTDTVSTKTFHYSDNSQSGLAKVDGSLAYLRLEHAQQLCGMAGPARRANAIHIKFKPDVRLEDGCEKVAVLWQGFRQEKADQDKAYLLNAVRVQSWKDYRRASIAPMENEQIEMTVMFCFVAVVVVFIVFVVFYMIISHKSKDIGILKSIGVSNGDIIQLFSGFALLIGIIGSGIGLSAGWAFLLNMNKIEDWLFKHFDWQVFDRTIYAIGDLPSQVDPGVMAIIGASAIVSCLIGALIPSWQTARQKPADALQVNQL
ncbi:MAG: ABC transporter permease [Planctomycetota bacterium]|jgi:lipoprotein-releasing system permease protein